MFGLFSFIQIFVCKKLKLFLFMTACLNIYIRYSFGNMSLVCNGSIPWRKWVFWGFELDERLLRGCFCGLFCKFWSLFLKMLSLKMKFLFEVKHKLWFNLSFRFKNWNCVNLTTLIPQRCQNFLELSKTFTKFNFSTNKKTPILPKPPQNNTI